MKATVLKKFTEVFGDAEGVKVYFAPGRVNLIGEHTDYNGGHVFPCALTIGTYGVARKREDNKLRFYSMNFEHLGIIESSLDDLKPLPLSCRKTYQKIHLFSQPFPPYYARVRPQAQRHCSPQDG